jgi:energy-coupling factor transporter ATP-binding protein EcfA2
MNDERITYFGQTDARNKKVTFGLKAKDRTKHVYVIGKTGMGKSTLLENMAVQDIKNGEGMAFIDPHGKTAELLLEYVPEHRMKDVVYFAPFDTEFPISFNVLESVDPDKRHLVVSGLMSTFKKIWMDAWSARMEYILTNTLLALLEYPDATLLGVNRMLSDKTFRNQVVAHVTDPSVKSFWTQEFANYTERMAAEAVPAIQNKIGQFTANALIRNMIGQPKSSFDIRQMMDQGKLLIINLSKGRIGESNANLLGGMLITKIYLAALSRADVPDRVLKTLPNFYLFVDEFQSFANESFADILSEARKYKLNLTIAHQYIEQMEEEVRAAVFGNVGTMIVFRVGAYDAEILEKEFAPQFTAEDIVNLGIYQIYLKLMIDGISSSPFSATTIPPIEKPEHSSMQNVIEMSRQQFAHERAKVEKDIENWMAPIKPPEKPKASAVPATSPALAPVAPKAATPVSTPVAPKPAPAPVAKPQAPIAPKPPAEQPFKKAFEAIKATPAPAPAPVKQAQPQQSKTEQKPVALNSLAPKPNQKQATPQRVNELKSALASALGTKDLGQVPKPQSNPQPQQQQRVEIKTELKKEIAEDVLKSVLKVD